VRSLAQLSREVTVMMTGHRQLQKHIEGGTHGAGDEKLEKISMMPNPQGRKSGLLRDWKQKRWIWYDMEVSFRKAITFVTGMSPQRIRNGDMPVGSSGKSSPKKGSIWHDG
jgi:hypothetical protein